MKKERLFIRNFDAGSHLETLLITAVATVLIIRAFLELIGYPKLGGEKLHIAHVLWDGLFMLVSILMLSIFLGKWRERLAVVFGGVGFGYFFDEVGKFLTYNNEYFFKPSVAVMYVVFILISIFLIQVFIFYREEFGALLGLVLNLLILAALRFMLEKESPGEITLNRE